MSYSQPEKSVALANGIVRKPTRILLVDDHSLSGKLLKTQLKPEPTMAIVGTAATEAEAFTAIQQLVPDLVAIDFEMPGINGYSITQKIHRHFPEIKIVVFTNRNQSDHLNQALSLGANGFLFKNSHTEEVKNVIRAITSVSSNNLQLQLTSTEEKAIARSNYSASESSEIVHIPTQLPAVVAEREDWSAATKDLLDALPQIWTRSLLYMLIIGTAIILPWSILTEVDQTGTARGRLEPKDKIIRLDAPVAGKVEAILVKEGDAVKAGAILAELESDLANSELEQLNEKRSGLLQRLTQLELMQNQSITTLTTQEQQNQSRQLEKQSQLDQAQQNLDTLQALYQSQKDEKLAQLKQAKQAIDSSKAAQKEANIALLGSQEKAQRYEQAFKDGVIDQDRFKDVQQVAKENQERLVQARSETEQVKSRLKEQQSSYDNLIKNAEAEIEQASLRLEEQKRGSQTLVSTSQLEQLKTEEQSQDLKSQVTTLKTEIAQINKQIESSQFQLKQRELIAPGDGTVFHIPARGVGTVVQPGESMVEIAPKNSSLILRAEIPPTDSGFLKVGMPVKVKFDAYPFQDYGVSDGELIWISPDSKMAETPQGKQEVFELKVKLDKPYIQDQDKRITLTPGQTATAEVVIRQRRVIDFFLDPFKKLQEDGMKL